MLKFLFSILAFPSTLAFSLLLMAQNVPAPSILLPWLIIGIFIFLNAFFVSVEFSLVSADKQVLEEQVKNHHPKAQTLLNILQTLQQKNRYIATAQVGITLISLSLGIYGVDYISQSLLPYLAKWLNQAPDQAFITNLSYFLAIISLTYIHLVISEMVPKSLSIAAAEKNLVRLENPLKVMYLLLGWLAIIFHSLGNGLLKLLGVTPTEQQMPLQTPEELELIVSESVEGGLLYATEETMIHNIFSFGERQVNQVMTPRRKVEAIPHDTPLPEILQLVSESIYSRFPVYEEDLDHIIGILHLKDLVRQQLRTKGNFDLRLLLRPAPTVPENYPIEQLLTAFKRRRIHLAIVRDEFGGTAGIVTLEDLVEEIVGEVRDEFDAELEPFVELEPGHLEVSGRYLLDDLSDLVDLGQTEDLPDVETVGGLITTVLGRPATPNDSITYNENLDFTVLNVDGLAVARVRIQFPTEALDD